MLYCMLAIVLVLLILLYINDYCYSNIEQCCTAIVATPLLQLLIVYLDPYQVLWQTHNSAAVAQAHRIVL